MPFIKVFKIQHKKLISFKASIINVLEYIFNFLQIDKENLLNGNNFKKQKIENLVFSTVGRY